VQSLGRWVSKAGALDHYAQPIAVEAEGAGVPETPSPLAKDGVAGSVMQAQLDCLEAELTSAMAQLRVWYPGYEPGCRWPCGYALTRRLRKQTG
jgi:hypothetical protein